LSSWLILYVATGGIGCLGSLLSAGRRTSKKHFYESCLRMGDLVIVEAHPAKFATAISQPMSIRAAIPRDDRILGGYSDA
jgi:hypothetical protein